MNGALQQALSALQQALSDPDGYGRGPEIGEPWSSIRYLQLLDPRASLIASFIRNREIMENGLGKV